LTLYVRGLEYDGSVFYFEAFFGRTEGGIFPAFENVAIHGRYEIVSVLVASHYSDDSSTISSLTLTYNSNIVCDLVIFRHISTKLGVNVYIFLLNSCTKFHAKMCTHWRNVDKSHRGYVLCSFCR